MSSTANPETTAAAAAPLTAPTAMETNAAADAAIKTAVDANVAVSGQSGPPPAPPTLTGPAAAVVVVAQEQHSQSGIDSANATAAAPNVTDEDIKAEYIVRPVPGTELTCDLGTPGYNVHKQ